MPYKTPYGSHYHMTKGCHGATIPCDTTGLTPCSDCCGAGADGDSGSSGGSAGAGGVGSPMAASVSGEFAADDLTEPVATDMTPDLATDGELDGWEPTEEDLSDADAALSGMAELYATGGVTAPDPSVLGRLAASRERARRAIRTSLAVARGRVTDACERLGGVLSLIRGFASPAGRRMAKESPGIVRKLGATVAAFAFAFSMSGCGTAALAGEDVSKAEQYTAAQAIHQMESADQLTLRKANISLGDRWDVYADGHFVATIDGEAIYLVGDTYTLRSTNGEFISSEREDISVITGRATKLDADGNEVGRYDEELAFLHHRIGFTDGDGNATGSMESRLWPPTIRNHAEVMDADGDSAWEYSEEWLSWDNATVHLDRHDDADDMDVTDAVMGAAIYHEQTAPKRGGSSHHGDTD